jgi:hypothetical protein
LHFSAYSSSLPAFFLWFVVTPRVLLVVLFLVSSLSDAPIQRALSKFTQKREFVPSLNHYKEILINLKVSPFGSAIIISFLRKYISVS